MGSRINLLLVTFFDTAGTLVGLANQAGFMKDNKMPRVGKALASDSTAMLAGSLLELHQLGLSLNLLPESLLVAVLGSLQ